MAAIQRDYKDTNFITGLRAIAILLVFLIHSGGGGLREMNPALNLLVDIGKYGVQIFFVISGFTIFNQLFSEHYSLRDFLMVRILRISIPYYPLLFLVFIYINLGGKQFNDWAIQLNEGEISTGNLIAHLTYLSSYFKKYQNTIIGVEWTLGIEVFFYFLFGILIKSGVFKLKQSSLFWFGMFFFSISVLLIISAKLFSWDKLMLYWTPINYGYMFFLGGLAYYLRKNIPDSFFDKLKTQRQIVSDLLLSFLFIILIAFLISATFFKTINILVEVGFVLSTFLIIVFFNDKGKFSLLIENKALLFLGSISYSFYLLHYIVTPLLPNVKSTGISFLMKLSVTIVLSFFWYLLFEKNIYNSVKRKIRSCHSHAAITGRPEKPVD